MIKCPNCGHEMPQTGPERRREAVYEAVMQGHNTAMKVNIATGIYPTYISDALRSLLSSGRLVVVQEKRGQIPRIYASPTAAVERSEEKK